MSGNAQAPGPESSSITDRTTLSGSGSTNVQEHADTQRSLQQASVALEVAYNRIRQVRRSLLQLSESLPNPDNLPRFSANYNEVRPGHEALLLSGDRSEGIAEMDREPASLIRLLASMPSPSTGTDIGSLEQSAVARETDELQGANEAFLRGNSSPLLFQPILPPNVLPPRFSRRELPSDMQYFQRRGINQDSASTLRGLRVAAREASGREGRDDVSVQSAEHDRLLREADGDSVLGGNNRAERQTRLARNVDSRDGRRAGPSPPLPSAPPSWRVPDPRRWRTRPDVRTTSRPFNGDASDRFNSLSTMLDSAMYTPQVPRNVPRFPLSTESGTMPPLSTAYEQYRLFQEARRPDEVSSNIANIDWFDEEFISWLFHAHNPQNVQPPREPPQNHAQSNSDVIRITRTTDTAVSPPDNSPPRRGWARLDPDGNEIPHNEEEELERSRTAYRLQALQRARQNAAAQIGNNANNPLVGGMLQNNGDQRNIYGSVLDSTLRIQEDRYRRHDQEGDSSPLYVDPLPMPLSSMVSNPEVRKDHVRLDIFVPKNACLAGR